MTNRMVMIDAPGFDSSKDELVVILLTGYEGISRLFNFQLGLISKNLDIKPDQFIGKQVNVSIESSSGAPRHINGFISRFSAGGVIPGKGTTAAFRSYHAEVVPWLWFLTQTSDCRVFNSPPESKLKVVSIIEEVLKECQHNNFMLKSMGPGKDYETEYCVQYRESDFNFVSRLMEQYGIYYYFVHTLGSHKMVLSDVAGGYGDCVEGTVDFAGTRGGHALDHLTAWEHDYEFVPGKYAHTDYDFKKPSNYLGRNSGRANVVLSGHEDYELFDFPGEYDTTSNGTKLADARMGVEEVAHNGVRGASTCRTFMAGHRTTLQNHAASGEDGAYVMVSVQHTARQPGPHMGLGGSAQYANSFTCIPATRVFRPPHSTPKPTMSGIQSALVVGPEKQEIHCDKFGRIRVRFHWEREGVGKARHQDNKQKTPNEKCTCWIRVCSQVAGNKWGWVGIPRIGQEVVVDFLEGDPDRPIVVGSVYNQEQMPHYDLPENWAKTYIKTNSTKGGDGFNEIMFDDAADKERLYMHAERDKDVVVKNNSKEHIYGNRHWIVGGEKKEAGKPPEPFAGDLIEYFYGHNRTVVRKHKNLHVHGGYSLLIGSGECSDKPGEYSITVEKKEMKKIGKEGKHLTVEGDYNSKIDGKLSIAVGGEHHETCGGYAMDSGKGDIYLKSGMNVVVEAGMKLTLKCGGSFVTISPAGVDISGPLVKINSGGAAGSGSAPGPKAPELPSVPGDQKPDEAWDSKTGFKSSKD